MVVLSRRPRRAGEMGWDGARPEPSWTAALEGADVVLNLAGRSVDCRYSEANLAEMMDSRVASTRAVGQAIGEARCPPAVWLQMSTATIYEHCLGPANDEYEGILGVATEPPDRGWGRSVAIAKAWEAAQEAWVLPKTRKLALRTAITLVPEPGGIFGVLSRLTRIGLGGRIAGGEQWVSWLHGGDFLRALEFFVASDLEGPVNLCSPNPVRQAEFQAALRAAWGVPVGLPATTGMVRMGAALLRTEPELVLKSRRVVPRRLLEAGFRFEFPDWPRAAADLVAAWPNRDRSGRVKAPAL